MSSDDDPGAGTGAAEPRPPRAPDAGPSEMTSTLSLGSAEVEPEGGGADPDQAAVEALPAGSALLVVRRGPNAGSRFLLDADVVTAGRHPDSDIFLDDVTVSRRHARVPPRRGAGFAVARRRAASTAPTSTGDRIDEAAARRRRRGADRQVPAGLPGRAERLGRASRDRRGRRPAAYLSIGEVLAELRPDFPDVTISKIRFLEAEGLVEPQRTAVGLPQVQPRRRRAAALRPAGPARPVPAAAGDPRAPRRDRPRARAAGRPPAPVRGCRMALVSTDGLPDRRVVPPGRVRAAAVPRPSCSRPPGSPRSCSRQLESYGLVGRKPGAAHYDGDALVVAKTVARAGRVRPRATAPAGVPVGRRPRGRPGRAGRDAAARSSATRRPGSAPTRSCASSPRSPCACTRPWSRPRSATPAGADPGGPPPARWPVRAPAVGVDGVHQLDVVGVRVEMPSNQPIVLLREVDGRALPADLDRRRRGHRDRLRPAGRGAAPAADPRPAARRPRRRSADELTEVRITELRDGVFYAAARLRRRASRSAPVPRTRSRWPCAPARRSSAPRRCSTRPASSIPDEQEDEVEKFREFLDQISPEDFERPERADPASRASRPVEPRRSAGRADLDLNWRSRVCPRRVGARRR